MAHTRKLLAVFPHPDDETFALGGVLAKYAAEGVETHLICATRGERGWNGPSEDDPGPNAMGRMREIELRNAAKHLGLHGLHFLDYCDGDVDQANPQEIIPKIASHIRRIQPQVVVTFSPDGHYGHPDHIALSQFTLAAILCAANTGLNDPAQLAPYCVAKFYHVVDTKGFVQLIQEKIGGIRMTIDGVERNQVGWEEWAVTTQIDVTNYFEQVWQAVLCHQSQLPGYGPLTGLPEETLRKLLGHGSLVRMFSLVNAGRTVEEDVFEGIEP